MFTLAPIPASRMRGVVLSHPPRRRCLRVKADTSARCVVGGFAKPQGAFQAAATAIDGQPGIRFEVDEEVPLVR
ncbi:cell division protein, FtsK/SpoIIIE family [Microbacterium sp. HM58-2]|nr:cell division protein, FtsK/SpoIIIE family [Microbacterium sp. HM58-2]